MTMDIRIYALEDGEHLTLSARQDSELGVESIIWLTPEDARRLIDMLCDGLIEAEGNRESMVDRREAVTA